MFLYHGEDVTKSRQALTEFKQSQQAAGLEVVSFSGKEIQLTDLRQALESANLLGTSRIVVIEGLFSAPKSSRVEQLLTYLKNLKTTPNLLLWEAKKINANRFKALRPEVREFTLPKLLFTWLEGIAPSSPALNLKLCKKLVESQAVELLAFMLARQLRALLTAKFEPELLTGPGWLTGKIKAQAGKFTQGQLLEWHRQQYLIDKEIKTGQSLLPFAERLSELLISI